MRIIITDDHAIVRAGLRQLIASHSTFEDVREARCGSDLTQQLERESHDLVILDISLGEESGFDLLPRIRRDFPNTAVLVLSMFAEEEYAIRALSLGASGYLTKESAPDELMAAIRKIGSGGTYVTPDLAEKLAFRLRPSFYSAPHERLSNREFQILALIGEGRTATEIAKICCISVKTVSTHRQHILQKLELTTTPQLIRYALERHLSTRS